MGGISLKTSLINEWSLCTKNLEYSVGKSPIMSHCRKNFGAKVLKMLGLSKSKKTKTDFLGIKNND